MWVEPPGLRWGTRYSLSTLVYLVKEKTSALLGSVWEYLLSRGRTYGKDNSLT